MTLPVLLVFCFGVLVTLRVETWAVRFLEAFQIAPVIATREQGEWKRLYVYTIMCKPRDESSRKNVEIVRPVATQ